MNSRTLPLINGNPSKGTRVAAHLAALTPLPTALWRLLLVLGLPAGFTERGLTVLDIDGSGRFYPLALSVPTELAALLTLGLVRPWGETAPGWVPALGGRRIPARLVVTLASIGTVVLLVLWTPFVLWWTLDHHDMTRTGHDVVGLLYLPLVAWGPLLGAVTLSFARRHRA
jgi:hypothetical protein